MPDVGDFEMVETHGEILTLQPGFVQMGIEPDPDSEYETMMLMLELGDDQWIRIPFEEKWLVKAFVDGLLNCAEITRW